MYIESSLNIKLYIPHIFFSLAYEEEDKSLIYKLENSEKMAELYIQLEKVQNELEEFENRGSVCQVKKNKELGVQCSRMVSNLFVFIKLTFSISKFLFLHKLKT